MRETVGWAAEKMINEAEWLDEKTKELAINKLHHMKQTIGASNISINVQQLDEYYGNLNFLDRDSARDLYVKIIMFQRQKDLLKCAKPETYDEVAERYRSSTNNCFYSFKNNQFDIFDAYIEFSNFYKSNVPAVVKFGKMGFVIGHETFHSFTTGIQFDENGNRSDWFDSRSMEQFHERAKCFTDQYSAIKDLTTGINLNGTRTFSENLPDHAGLRASYFAFKQFNDEWNSTSAMQTDYTPTQLFFMSYGAAWCKKYSTGQQQYIIITDPHSPNEYRINEVLKNVPEFAEAFKCAAGTKMNPNKRCKIW
ncbi:Peptidase family M13 [Aphelenchoides bicaudatus]|nr:Peptidase family M13 [Aphelenchoides bicaudatus]